MPEMISAKGAIYIIGERHFEAGVNKALEEVYKGLSQTAKLYRRGKLGEHEEPMQKTLEQSEILSLPFRAFENEIRLIEYVVKEKGIRIIFVESDPSGTISFLRRTLEKILPRVSVVPLIETKEFYEPAMETVEKLSGIKATLISKMGSLPPTELMSLLNEYLRLMAEWEKLSMKRQGIWAGQVEKSFLDPSLIVCGGYHVTGQGFSLGMTITEPVAHLFPSLREAICPYKTIRSMLDDKGFKTRVIACATQ